MSQEEEKSDQTKGLAPNSTGAFLAALVRKNEVRGNPPIRIVLASDRTREPLDTSSSDRSEACLPAGRNPVPLRYNSEHEHLRS